MPYVHTSPQAIAVVMCCTPLYKSVAFATSNSSRPNSPQLHPPNQEFFIVCQTRTAKGFTYATVAVEQVTIKPNCKMATTTHCQRVCRPKHEIVVAQSRDPPPSPSHCMRLHRQIAKATKHPLNCCANDAKTSSCARTHSTARCPTWIWKTKVSPVP
jgi:hypothetical protein